jgi:hypothetical protein
MIRFLTILLCLPLIHCVESAEERLPLQKESDTLRKASVDISKDIVVLKGKIEGAKINGTGKLALDKPGIHTVKLSTQGLHEISVSYRLGEYSMPFVDWVGELALDQYWEIRIMDKGTDYAEVENESCPETLIRSRLRKVKLLYQLNRPLIHFFKNMPVDLDMVEHTQKSESFVFQPFMDTVFPQLVLHHQRITALEDWKLRLKPLLERATQGTELSLQDFVDAGFPRGADSKCESGVGWERARAWFYSFWMRRHADGTFDHVVHMMEVFIEDGSFTGIANEFSDSSAGEIFGDFDEDNEHYSDH